MNTGNFASNGFEMRTSATYTFDWSIPSLPHEVCSLLAQEIPIEVTVYTLLHPPPEAFVGGILSLKWAVLTAGWSHFEPRDPDERPVLTKESRLRTEGMQLGITDAYHNWLCGDDPDYTETEDGFILTPSYFHGLR